MVDLERNLVDLSLEDGEEEVMGSLEASIAAVSESLDNCFVGSFFTTSVVSFLVIRVTLAKVWHPIGGISITDLNKGRYLFRLYHCVDANKIEA